MVDEVVQSSPKPTGLPCFRGRVTLIVDHRNWDVRYIIYKRLYEQLPPTPGGPGILAARYERQRAFEEQLRLRIAGESRPAWQGEAGDDLTTRYSATYASAHDTERRTAAVRREPFAFLHRALDS